MTDRVITSYMHFWSFSVISKFYLINLHFLNILRLSNIRNSLVFVIALFANSVP